MPKTIFMGCSSSPIASTNPNRLKLILFKIQRSKYKFSFYLMTFILLCFLSNCFTQKQNIPEPIFNDQLSVMLENSTQQPGLNSFKAWEAGNKSQGGPNSFAIINYEKCIPVNQCKFEDCDIEGSRDEKGNFCLPVDYSNIGNWVPDVSVNFFGVTLVKNPAVYTTPIEHTQASARLPDKNNNAYFMFTNSQNRFGFIWVVEVRGIDPLQPEHIDSSMQASVVWWQKLNKCHFKAQCENPLNPGNYNHPARISYIDGVAVVAFQNWSFTVQGAVHFSRVSKLLENIKISIPERLQTSTLPIYPDIRSSDAVAFYDVSNPRKPKFVKKLLGDRADLWGGYPPGRDISEVSLAKVGTDYHINVGGTRYNFDGDGNNQLFFINYKMKSLMFNQDISPILGDVSANMFTNLARADQSQPTMVSLNTVPNYKKYDYSLTLQLITSRMKYHNSSMNLIDSVFIENDTVVSSNIRVKNAVYGNDGYVAENQVLGDLIWISEACKRAWGFQMLSNGGFNVICHDVNPKGDNHTAQGRFIVRGVSGDNKPLIQTKALIKRDKFS